MWKWTRSLRNCAPMVQTQAIVMASLSLSDYVKMLISRRTFLREHPKFLQTSELASTPSAEPSLFTWCLTPHVSPSAGEGLRKRSDNDLTKCSSLRTAESFLRKVNATFERVSAAPLTPFVIRTKPEEEAPSTENKKRQGKWPCWYGWRNCDFHTSFSILHAGSTYNYLGKRT